MTLHARALVAVSALALGACATAPAPAPALSGRLALQVEATLEHPAQSFSAAFELRGDAQRGALQLLSPLGTTLADARWAPGETRLRTSAGEARFDDLQELSRQALGEALPLAALPDWLAGRPWAGAAHATIDNGFEQLGWQVLLTRRAEGWIEARRAAPPAVLLRVRLDDAS